MPFAAWWSADGPAVELDVGRHCVHVVHTGTGEGAGQQRCKELPAEISIPLIAAAARLPQTESDPPKHPVVLHLYTFETYILHFASEKDASSFLEQAKRRADIGESLLTASVTELPAYQGDTDTPGWRVYDAVGEFKRQGIGSATRAWRVSRANANYSMCASYPGTLVVPAHVSDATVAYAAKFRSRGRVPSLTYFHRMNHASISRASQPMTGLKQGRSAQDEKLVEAIFETHADPDSPAGVFGASKANIIVDARSYTNAVANMAKGAGTEIMENYRSCTKTHLGIDNIHVMRDALGRVVQELRKADLGPPGTQIDQLALRQSGWLKHLTALLAGVIQVVKTVHVLSSHALVHCSDGWDRTAQVVSLAQICLDPYFRTCRGFAVLVEKDWMSFGHRFCERNGLVGFAADRFNLAPPAFPEPRMATDAYEELQEDKPLVSFWDFRKQFSFSLNGGAAAQRSPIFLQFLDAVAQLVRQFPSRFEYDAEFLAQVFKHAHNGASGSFLHNCEQERTAPPTPANQSTPSVWDAVLETHEWRNPAYDPSLDASSGDMGVLIPNSKDVLFTPALLKRSNDELNSTLIAEAEQQRRLDQRLRNASAAPKLEKDEDIDDPLQNAATKMRSYISTGWGRMQDAWRSLDESPKQSASPKAAPEPAPLKMHSPRMHNPWAKAPSAHEAESLTVFSLEPPRQNTPRSEQPKSGDVSSASFDPLGVREI
ncbi:hypothetical protein MCUN1_002918 [Malassezia cuniculi]|uniref:Myotubularin phosphatase domain-containing protein n=1 Tax=Malassezia cuniculi TaxID=948313 RepID=A0AAF0EWJ0_9BASI|nr:hypothetical protein MCUN1_002918 [Malassezia cuniculi]